MNARVRFEEEADAEYRHAGQWYEERRPGLGLEFFDAVDEAIDHVVDLPGIGFRIARLPAAFPARRFAVARFPYHVVYLETAADIRILAVAHDRRRPGYWKSRLR